MRKGIRYGALAALLSMSVAGCNCDPANSVDAKPVVKASPTSVSYGQVCNDSTNTQIVTLTNDGAGSANFELSFIGPDAALFSADPATGVLAGTGSKVDVTVTYTPTADAGSEPGARHAAELVVTYNGDDSPKKIAVDSLVSTNKVEPLSSFACGDEAMKSCQQDPGNICCSMEDQLPDGFVGVKTVMFPEIAVGATGRLPLKALNKGCGTLTVTSVEFVEGFSDCDDGVISVEGTLPATIAGSADHNAPGASDLELVFRPTTMCTYTGEVVITTDDPTHQTERFSVTATSSEPKISATPSSHSFGEICAPEEGQQSFNIRNTGNKALSIDSIEIDPADSHFEIEKVEVVGCDDSRTEVTTWPHELVGSDSMPSCGNDEIVVDVRFRPEADCGRESAKIIVNYGGSAGTIEIDLLGGSNPAIVVKPDVGLKFQMPKLFGSEFADCAAALDTGAVGTCTNDASCTAPDVCLGESGTADGLCTGEAACLDICGVSYKPFQVCNEGDANLAVGNFEITGSAGGPAPTHPDTGAPLFEIVANGCVDADLAKGQCCEATLQYSNTNVGLSQFATVLVHSNDPLYADGFPASAQAISDSDTPPDVHVVQTDPLGAKIDSWVRIDGSLSEDVDGPEIARYTWTLKQAVSIASKWVAMEDIAITEGVVANPANGGVCPGNINGGDCFRCMDSKCRAIEFWPDLHTEGDADYEWELKVESGYCEPLLDDHDVANVKASE